MPSLQDRVVARVARVRERRPLVDHAVRTQAHYGDVNAAQQAGGVTYYAFLSFFPVTALAFFVVGYVAMVYPDAEETLATALDEILPGLIGPDTGQVSLQDIEDGAATVGLLGLAGVLYTGLGWISALRTAFVVVFELPDRGLPGFVTGKLRDLLTLAVAGVMLFVAVALSGFVRGFSEDLLEWVGLDTELGWLLWVVTAVLGLAANCALFFLLFRMLADPPVPARSLWSGALLGAVGFEVLKQVSGLLLATTKNQPAFQAFGIALILVVWINYFSRVILYAAAWAHTSAAARAQRRADPSARVQGPQVPPLTDLVHTPGRPDWAVPFAAGGATVLGVLAVLRWRRR